MKSGSDVVFPMNRHIAFIKNKIMSAFRRCQIEGLAPKGVSAFAWIIGRDSSTAPNYRTMAPLST